MKKRILSLLLAAAMVLSMLPTAFAEEAADPLYETVIEEENEMTEEAVPAAPEESYVAWLDTDDEPDYSNVVAWNDTDNDGVIDSEETTYATLYDSLNAGGEVKLYRDYDASAEGYIEVGGDEHVTVVLDLNGKELAFNDTSAIDIFAASVTLRDSDGYGSVTTEGESAISCNEEAMLIIADGIMISSIVSTRFDNSMETEITEYGEAIDVAGGRVIIEDGWFHGDISVSGGDVTIESGRFYKKIFVSGGTLTILDGRFEDGWQSFGGLIVTGGEVFIEGGAFVGESNRVSISGGSVTISGGTFNSKDYYAVMTGGDGTLLITDGDFTGGSEFGHGAAHFAGDSTVIIEGGTFIGAAYGIYVDGADVSTYGGTFDGDTAAYAAEGSAVAIFDGTFSAAVYGFCAYGANVNIDGGVFDGDIAASFVNGSSVTISDGVFSGTFGGIQVNGADVSISGGSYSSDPSAYVAEEYVVTEDAETGMWTVAEAAGEPDYSNVVAWLDTDNDGVIDEDESTFEMLADAFAAVADATVEDNAIIKMNADVDLGENTLTILSGVSTLDLNGHLLRNSSSYGGVISVGGANVTITDSDPDHGGKITTNNYICIQISSGELTIANGTIVGDMDGVRVAGGNLTVTGGTITGESCGISVLGAGSATIIDGSMIATSENGFGCGMSLQSNVSAVISGGVFTGDNCGIQVSVGSTATISGGTFTSDSVGVKIWDSSSAEISGGTFTGGFGLGVDVFDNSSAVISGGVFNDSIGRRDTDCGAAVIGGSFSQDPSAYVSYGCAVEEDPSIGMWTVSGTPVLFSVAAEESENGTVSIDKSASVQHDLVTLSIMPSEGYELEQLMVDGEDVTMDVFENQYKLVMPAKDIAVNATFREYIPGLSGIAAWFDDDHDDELDSGETTFTSLADAVTAVADATADDNAVIKLFKSVNVGRDRLWMNSGVFTLDLNGQVLRTSSSHNEVIMVDGANVTIIDSDPNHGGEITANNYECIRILSGELTIENGMLSYIDAQPNSTLSINGGTISGVSAGNSNVTINGGTISDMSAYQNSTVTINDGTVSSVYADNSDVTINGGTVSSVSAYQNSTVNINGGTVSGGMYAYQNSTVTINDGTISSESYGVFVYSSDVTINGGMISGDNYGVSASNSDVTINGGTVSGVSAYQNSTVTINDGTISSESYGVSVGSSDVTINGGTISGSMYAYQNSTVTINDGTVSSESDGIRVVSSDVTINGGTIYSDGFGVIAYNDGSVTVLGGTITGDVYGLLVDDFGEVIISGGTISSDYIGVGVYDLGHAEITGGTISGSYKSLEISDAYGEVTGGSYNTDPSEYLTEGYTATEDAETGMWTVAEGIKTVVAWIDADNNGEIDSGEKTYTTLYDALNAGGEVKMYRDYDASAEGSIKVGYGANPQLVVTLDLNGKTITSDAIDALYPFNADITIDDRAGNGSFITTGECAVRCGNKKTSLVINGGTFAGKYYAVYAGGATVEINGGNFTGGDYAVKAKGSNGHLTINGGAFWGKIRVLHVEEGNLTINDGTFTGTLGCVAVLEGSTVISGGAFTSRDAAAYAYGGSLTISGGTFVSDTNRSIEPVSDCIATVTGGSYNADPSDYLTEGSIAVLNSETGYYDVQEGTVGVKITAQPEDYVGMVGDTVKFVVAAEGEGLTYQWYYFDAAKQKWMKSSSTEAALAVEFKSYRNGQQYKCVITDAEGNSVESDVVSILAEEMELVIHEQPVSHVGAVNDNVLFYVGAEGNGLVYQWYYSTDGGENWMKSYSPGYDTNALEPILRAYRNGQQYYCEITDVFGNVVLSDVVDMTVRSSEVVIVKQPETVEYGVLNQLHYFTVEAEGDNLTYQWEVSMNGGETWEKSYNSGYDTAELTVRMYGYRSGYLYRCVITSGLQNTVITDEVALNLQPASVQIVSEPVSCGYVAQKNVNFHVEVEGMDLTYQWYRSNDGGNTWVKTYLDGYDTDTLYFKATAARCAVYRCIITDGSGKEAYSKAAKLTLIEKELVLLSQPEDMYCQNGDTAVFALEAEGAGLKYQWYASGDGGESWTVTYLGGSDTDTLSFKVNETRAAKLYKCVITDGGNNTVETQPVSAVIGTVERYEARIQPIYFNGEYTWRYDMTLTNNSNYDATLMQITILKRLDGNVVDKRVFTFSMTGTTIPLVLAPGESYTDNDGIPMVTEYDCIEYYFTLRNTAGEQKIVVYSYSLDSELPEIFRTDAVEAPFNNGFEDRWQFEMELENNGKQELALEQVLVLKKQGGEDGALVAVHDFKEEQLKNLGLNGLTLQPGENYMWGDGHPVVDEFDFMQYVFNFVNEEGRREIQIFSFDLLREAEADSDLVKPRWNGVEYDWRFQMPLTNESDSVLEVKRLIIDKRDGDENGTLAGGGTFEQDDLMYGVVTLQPGETFVWDDGFPYRENVDYVEYLFVLCDAAGNETEISYEFRLSHELPGIEDDGLVKPQWNGMEYDWRFNMELVNEGDSALTLERLVVEKRQGGVNGALVREHIHEAEGLRNIGLGDENGPMVLQPDGRWAWNDGHPVVDYFDFMGYTFTFRDEAGRLVEIVFEYPLSHELPEREYPSYADDEGYDLQTLRHDADYSVQVADGVYWVPANALGSSNYTNAQIQQMLTEKPETKQDQVNTLYEALQLYQVGAFSASDDNIRVYQNGINWEHHKPGYHAVRTNTGCCATSANWLRYILDGDYEEIGYLATSQRDGSGHIFNYIKQGGWYYFVDLTHYRTDWVATAVESGDMNDYYRSDYVLGNIHKVQDVQDYVDYLQANFNDPPGLMFRYTAENCLALDGIRVGDKEVIHYEKVPNVNLQVVFDDPADNLEYSFALWEGSYPDWWSEESFDFSVIR